MNSTSSTSVEVTLTETFSCSSYMSVIDSSVRNTYPLSELMLPSWTDNMRFSVFSHQFVDVGIYNISASVNVDGENVTSTDMISVHNEDDHHCLTQLIIEGTGTTMMTAKMYDRGHHLHFESSYNGSCEHMVGVSYNWTVFHYTDDDPRKCTFGDEFELVTVPESATEEEGSFHIPSKTLPRGYNRLCLYIVFTSSSSVEHRRKACVSNLNGNIVKYKYYYQPPKK